jgi:putative FmdB family regulatory protein
LPLYDYQCQACGRVTEVRHGFRETHDAACETCGGKLARKFNAAPIIFTGSGFYVTDSRPKAAAEGGAPASGEAKKPSTEAKKPESPAA